MHNETPDGHVIFNFAHLYHLRAQLMTIAVNVYNHNANMPHNLAQADHNLTLGKTTRKQLG